MAEQQKAATAIINYNGKILIAKKRSDYSNHFLAGKWHIPGETLEEGENDEQALIRGMKEETGLEIRVGKYLASHITPSGKECSWYECFTSTDKATPDSDVEEIKWVTKKEILELCRERAFSYWPQEIVDYFSNS